ncbi:MAG TPA: DNA-directed DNA polymerase [Candidatus Nanoarchaeia archaeon]|nr:DNA-directed DNA polymerase [Candidatus Nanoarchaeia archaeon]
MDLDFYPIDIDSLDDDKHKQVIRLFGRSADGKRACVIDRTFYPYFWAACKENTPESTAKNLAKRLMQEQGIHNAEVHHKKFLAKEVVALKITVEHSKAIGQAKHLVKDYDEIQGIFESDIPFVRRYLIDKHITPLSLCRASGKKSSAQAAVDIVIEADSINQISDEMLKPKIIAFDIEVYNPNVAPREQEDQICLLALYGKDFQKVIACRDVAHAFKYVDIVKDEKELITSFLAYVKEIQPDYLVGYFSDGFDFPYMRARAKKHGIDLDLGLDGSNVSFNKRMQTGSARITGFAHIDIYKFIRRITSGGEIELESYDLDTVAREMLGDGKKKVNLQDFHVAWDNGKDLHQYIEYNLKDAELTYRLAEVMLPNLHEMVKLVGQNLFDVARMTFGQFVEWYIIRNIERFNELIPNRPYMGEIEERDMESYEGAFVFEPQPGLYENIMGFDFRSLYPSIIVSHNICLSTITKEAKNVHTTPEIILRNKAAKYYFTKDYQGFLPAILKEIIERRANIKAAMKKEKAKNPVLNARQYGLKILANSFYGYFGFSGARWYNNECAASITAWARHYIHEAIKKFQDEGFTVLYSDTDSLYHTLGNKKRADALKLMENINENLPDMMELEFENYYLRGIFVMKKGEKKGAKKKYALIDEKNVIKVRGFETIRGDWSIIAREVQDHVLHLILEENDVNGAEQYVKQTIKDVRQKNLPKDKMVIRKQLKKKIENYDAVGPHVAVAQRLRERGIKVQEGSLISYIVCEGRGMIRDRAKPVDEATTYDAEYYIDHQILPAVLPLFDVLGIKEEFLKKDHQQKGVMDF